VSYGAMNFHRAFCAACLGGHRNVIDFMVSLGLDDWNAGLAMACRSGNIDLIEDMLDLGANDFTYGLEFALETEPLNKSRSPVIIAHPIFVEIFQTLKLLPALLVQDAAVTYSP